MIELHDQAVILRVDPFKEHDALVSAFSQQYGLLHGVVRYGLTSKQRGIYCVGNRIDVEWTARLEEHMGNLSGELITPSGAVILSHRERCYALQSLAALVMLAFEARDPHPQMYASLSLTIDALCYTSNWQGAYAQFELILLRETGFGLGLEACVVCGSPQHLVYVSPKSGCAVCKDHGAPYRDKCFALPALLAAHELSEEAAAIASADEVRAALRMTGHFIETWLLAAHDKKLPSSRARLMQALYKPCAEMA